MKNRLAGFFLLLLMLFVSDINQSEVQAAPPSPDCLPRVCYWGIITKKQLKLCLINVPGIPVPVPHPITPMFHYFEISQPFPPMFHKLYFVYGYSDSKLRNRREKTVYAMGSYVPGASEALRQSCTANQKALPIAFGVIELMGTGCKPGELVALPQGKCIKAKK